MTKRTVGDKLVKAIRNADDMAKIFTGRRIKDLFTTGMAILSNHKIENPDDPYNILHIQRSASLRTVKFAFRAIAYELHPDTGTRPDPDKFQKVKEAYDAIVKERNAAGETE